MKIKNPKKGAYKYFAYPTVRKDQDRLIEDLDRFLESKTIKTALIKGDTGLGKEAAIASQIAKHSDKFDHIIHLIPTDMGKINIEKELELINKKVRGVNINYVILNNKESMCKLLKEIKQKEEFKEKDIDVYNLCSAKDCDHRPVCEYYEKIDNIENYKVILCDYNYVFDPYIRKHVFKDMFDKKKILLLINEVHELPERITSQFSAKISSTIFKSVVSELKGDNLSEGDKQRFKTRFGNLNSTIEYVKEFEKDLNLLVGRRHDDFGGTSDNKIEIRPEHVFKNLRRSNKLVSLGHEISKWKVKKKIGTVSHTKALGGFLNKIKYAKDLDYYFFYLEKETEKKYKVGMACMNPYPLIKQPFNSVDKLILYSGTMYPDRYIRLFMLGKFGEIFVPEAYKAEYIKNRSDLFYSDGRLVKRVRESGMLNKSARELQEVIKKVPKPCAIFVVKPLWDKMSVHLDLRKYNVVVEEPKIDKRKFFSKIKAADISILSPYGSFKQSLDMSFLNTIIILGICDPMLGLVTRKTLEYYKEKFLKTKGIHSDWIAYELICRLPAVEKSLQAAGRGIRKETDHLLTIWFDERWIKQSRFIASVNKKNCMQLPQLITEINKYKRSKRGKI